MHRQPREDAQDHELRARIVSAVFWGGQDGDLPLFACTLGLPLPALFELLQWCHPNARELMRLKSSAYECIRRMTPAEFVALATLLRSNSSDQPDDKQADWLARAIAAACTGSRELWQDLGLSSEQGLEALMAKHLGPMTARKPLPITWKAYLNAAIRGRPYLSQETSRHCL